MAEDEGSRNLKIIVFAFMFLVFCALAAIGVLVCMPIVGLTVLGNSLESQFEAIDNELAEP